MAFDVWLAFIGAAILIAVSPGAGAIQSMAVGLTHGVRRGYWSILGLETGLMLQLTPWPPGWVQPSPVRSWRST